MNQNRKIYLSCWLFTISIGVGLIFPVLIQDGMFVDSVQYAAVAHNLKEGIGSVWSLQFDTYNIHDLPAFSEQPPLFFILLSFFYRIFGDSMYVERLYSAVTLIINGYLITLLWGILNYNYPAAKKFSWLPVLVWITLPVVFWGYQNDIIENTMSMFLLGAAILIVKSINSTFYIGKMCLASILVFFASFTKGLPGLFILSVPSIYFIIRKNISIRKTFVLTTMLVLIPICIYGVLLLWPGPRESYERYFLLRTIDRIKTENDTSYRLYILKELLMEILPMLALFGIFMLTKTTRLKIKRENKLNAVICLAIGLSGSLPLLLTGVQKTFYLSPALSFFALSFSNMAFPLAKDFSERLVLKKRIVNRLYVTSILAVVVAFIITLLNFGNTSRDKDLLSDIHAIGNYVPHFTTVKSSNDLYYYWQVQSFLIRDYNINLDYKGNNNTFLILDNRYDKLTDSSYTQLLSLKTLSLYKKCN